MGWDYEDFLRELLEAELRSREQRTAKRRLKEARFPEIKTLEQFEWEALEDISRQKIMELATCEYITKASDVILVGPVGTGKTHAAIGFGVDAARRRFRVAFFRAAQLVRMLTEARDERTLTLLHRRLRRADLLILDELGFVPFERTGGELLFDLISERYEVRLGHHAHVLTTKGSSFRTRKRNQKEGGGDGSMNAVGARLPSRPEWIR